MMQSEKEKMLHLEDEIGQRLIGQAEAVKSVSNAVRRSRAGLQDPNKPLVSPPLNDTNKFFPILFRCPRTPPFFLF